jgi:hypothetical protein
MAEDEHIKLNLQVKEEQETISNIILNNKSSKNTKLWQSSLMHELPSEIVMHIDVDFENEFKAWKERKLDRDNIIFDNSLVSDSDLLYIKHVELA